MDLQLNLTSHDCSGMSVFEAASTIVDPNKGRCLVAKKSFSVGDIIYIESAFIYSSCDPLPVHECFNYVFKAFKPKELVCRLIYI